MEKPDKMLSMAATMCSGERINSVSNVPQRDPTQFFYSHLTLGIVPCVKLPLIHSTLCPSLWMSYTVDKFVYSYSLPSTALLLYASYKMCELSTGELLLNPVLVPNQRSWNGCV